jgi:hypothetical protein
MLLSLLARDPAQRWSPTRAREALQHIAATPYAATVPNQPNQPTFEPPPASTKQDLGDLDLDDLLGAFLVGPSRRRSPSPSESRSPSSVDRAVSGAAR